MSCFTTHSKILNIFVLYEVLKLIQVKYYSLKLIVFKSKIRYKTINIKTTNEENILKYKNATINMFQFKKSVRYHYKKL